MKFSKEQKEELVVERPQGGSMPSVPADAKRKSDLTLIHVAKKALSLDDDAYRAILIDVTGNDSAGQLNAMQRQALLDRFKKIGFKVTAKHSGRAKPKAAPGRARLIGKIEAQLAEAKRAWSYADTLAQRICKVDRIEFCNAEHLLKIVAALSYDAKRNGREER